MKLVDRTTTSSQRADGTAAAKTRLVIIGTHPHSGWALWRVGTAADDVQPAGIADGMHTALGLCDSLAADVVVIDGSLDETRLRTLAAELRERHPDHAIFVVTSNTLVSPAAEPVRTTAFTTRFTRQEQQVQNLINSGGSVSQIAGLLRMDVTTAKSYVARVYQKLGASDRALALMAAVEHGLTETALAHAG